MIRQLAVRELQSGVVYRFAFEYSHILKLTKMAVLSAGRALCRDGHYGCTSSQMTTVVIYLVSS